MHDQPEIEDWHSFAHSVEVLAAAANANHELEGATTDEVTAPRAGVRGPEGGAPPPIFGETDPSPSDGDWLDFAHSVEVLAASAAATEDVAASREAAPTPLAAIPITTPANARGVIRLGRWQVRERSALAGLSAVAAVLVIAAISTAQYNNVRRSGSDQVAQGPAGSASMQVASADIAEGEAMVRRLTCSRGQDCWSQGSVIRGLGTPANPSAVVRTEEGRRATERSALAGLLPSSEMLFAVNSADLTGAEKRQLDVIGRDMASGALSRDHFRLIGHADGAETDGQALSLRRAQAIADYLMRNFGIEASRLDVYGRGGPSQSQVPGLRADRGVQIVNVGPVLAEGKPTPAQGAAGATGDCKQFLPLENVTISVPCK